MQDKTPKTPRKHSRSFGFYPIRTILFLGILVLILLYFILLFGLGSGGGRTLPGQGDSASISSAASLGTTTESFVAPPEYVTDNKLEPDEIASGAGDKPVVRRELAISFLPLEDDQETAREAVCRLNWIDPTTGGTFSKMIEGHSKNEFEFALEKAIRAWRDSLRSQTTINIPVVSVRMSPFPGEGTFQRISAIARQVDSRISLLRLESGNSE